MTLRNMTYWKNRGGAGQRLTVAPAACPNKAPCDFCNAGRLAVSSFLLRQGTRVWSAIACDSCTNELSPFSAPRQDGQETPGTPYKQQEPMSGGSAESWERGKTGLVGSFASIDMDTKRMNWLESEALRDTHYPPPLYRRNQVITRAAVDATMSAAPQLVPLTPTKNEQ